ncbi:hypothetical protein ACFOED_04035 [Vulcaniibacterium thermophilum]|uniref:Uncharacterized protein n=1 Tax=Vulcaniibacterium thermophilum TaxID=1169913 RepID=A0A918YVY6_9GAMM|nr:hypothetical protein [Vulcaniibacterium thermophilum]GHE26521.1 hypothetical protein GCM10007167_04750 [Vulcaniibacterium thermophilum]
MRTLVMLVCGAVLTTAPVPARTQYDPGATQMIAEALREHTMRDEINRQLLPRAEVEPSSDEGGAGIAARRPDAAQLRALRSEYARRVRRDGRPSADAWLRKAASELGSRAGAAERAPGDGR